MRVEEARAASFRRGVAAFAAAAGLLLPSLPAGAQAPAPNVLIVVLDDVGIDQLTAYGVNPEAAPTPVLSSLAQE